MSREQNASTNAPPSPVYPAMIGINGAHPPLPQHPYYHSYPGAYGRQGPPASAASSSKPDSAGTYPNQVPSAPKYQSQQTSRSPATNSSTQQSPHTASRSGSYDYPGTPGTSAKANEKTPKKSDAFNSSEQWRPSHTMYPPPPPGMRKHPREPAPPPGYWPPPSNYGPPSLPPPPPPPRAAGSRLNSYWNNHETLGPPPHSGGNTERHNDVDGREGATSPSQIESLHRDEVQSMGCTCKKTRCLKLYCQCFGVRLYCGSNCRCMNCFNTHKHEKNRKDAMRSILSRNPGAFDTKYKKNGQPAAAVVSAADPRVLTHKLGCKCRKSSCMKKYCECYAGNVKCSPNCRCMGCKNMGGSYYDHDSGPPVEVLPSYSISPHPHHVSSSHPMVAPYAMRGGNTTGEPWLAAQNLTFLKRGSPVADLKRKPGQLPEYGEIVSMPSLASTSDGTSPEDGVDKKVFGGEDGTNALLMAAMAMTEFGQSPSEKSTHETEKGPPKRHRTDGGS